MGNDRTETKSRFAPRVLRSSPGRRDEPTVLAAHVDAAFSDETLRTLSDSGLLVLDILAGHVPDLDPVEIITDEWERALQHDDYPRCLALLPHLLGEYGYG